MNPAEVRFCLRCGKPLVEQLQTGRLRPSCPACGWVYYADPRVAAAVLVETDDGVLLTRRVNTPRQGCWTLPAGFVDAGEDPERAAERECLEETGLQVQVTSLLKVFTGREHPAGADVVLVYAACITGGSLRAGDDADRAEFFRRSSLPELAFRATRQILLVE